MSTAVFPKLTGAGWNISRKAMWSTDTKTAASGADTRLKLWASPMYSFDINYDFLQSVNLQELQTLMGFFNQRSGAFDTFLFDWYDDDTCVNQNIGTGTGALTTFQLQRTMGGFTENILAPNTVTAVRVNGVAATFTVAPWGSTTPGLVTITSGTPANGTAITADFTFYYPVKFGEDIIDFNAFAVYLYELKTLTLKGVRNS